MRLSSKTNKALTNLWTIIIALLFCIAGSLSHAQEAPEPLSLDDPKGLELGPGVPRTVDTNGNVIFIKMNFTSEAYRDAAEKLMLNEANQVAGQLRLAEELPITVKNLTEADVNPFGYAYTHKTIGSIWTSNYVYFVTQDDKFNNLVAANYDSVCRSYEDQALPVGQINTNEAYQMATQFLSEVSMDVQGLNGDCTAHIAVSPDSNGPYGVERLGEKPRKKFVPMYFIWWTNPENEMKGYGSVAYVELYLPSRRLIQLNVKDPEYILRKPLIFTNLASLFPGEAPITLFTNWPAPLQIPGMQYGRGRITMRPN